MSDILLRVRFWVERLLLRGTGYRLLLFSIVTATIALIAGLSVHATGSFDTLGEATWWAFLRLTDAGYLGNDQGSARRSISVVVTVMGSVLFMGTLMAIMTQWLGETVERLERGETPTRRQGHLLVVGWTNRTAAIISELLLSEERTRRILRRGALRRLHVVLLAEDFGPQLQAKIKRDLGELWDESRLTVRRGDRLVARDLDRVGHLHAAGILLPGEDRDEAGEADRDTTTIKALLAISRRAADTDQQLPPLVAEIFDPRRAEVAREAYAGPAVVLASNRLMGRVLAQAVRNPGLSSVLAELLTHGHGNELYQRANSDHAGKTFEQAAADFEGGVLLGLLQHNGDHTSVALAPPRARRIAGSDQLVVLAPQNDLVADSAPVEAIEAFVHQARRSVRRVVILGWSDRVPIVVTELSLAAANDGEHLDVLQASPQSDVKRQQAIADALQTQPVSTRVQLEIHTGEPTLPATIAAIDWADVDRVIIVAGVHADPGEETDARTVVTELLVRRALRGHDTPPNVLVELTHESNASLYAGTPTEVIVTPLLVSHVLGQLLLRPALAEVFSSLLSAGGPSLALPDAGALAPMTFGALAAQLRADGAVLLGVFQSADRGGLQLNPGHDCQLDLDPQDRLVVLRGPQDIAAASSVATDR
ncbi:MAG: hypothetical protein KC502_07010 [Myxococcales bacterium]|nr:hypothetical protein [Myxococcales bacterium]